jgi:hypothetical protein
MNKRRVLIVGESAYAQGLAQKLADDGSVMVVATSPTVDGAKPFLAARDLDVVIVLGERGDRQAICSPLLTAQADLAIVYADMAASSMQVITSKSLVARTEDLMEAIAFLPAKVSSGDGSTGPHTPATDFQEGGVIEP